MELFHVKLLLRIDQISPLLRLQLLTLFAPPSLIAGRGEPVVLPPPYEASHESPS